MIEEVSKAKPCSGRPRGVTIFGAWLIALSSMQILSLVTAGASGAAQLVAGGFGVGESWARLAVALVAAAVLGLSAVGVLLRREVFRKTLVAGAGFFVFVLPWLLPFSLLKHLMKESAPLLSRVAGVCEITLAASLFSVTRLVFAGLSALMLAFFAGLIVYFSQPEVKAWFAE
jgi:hypothetical protein